MASLTTGSGSMVVESEHSWANTGNQISLFFAERSSRWPMWYWASPFSWRVSPLARPCGRIKAMLGNTVETDLSRY
ncbi:hypothetical protein [Arthrobacter sp. ERGS1:01]|uniref:hypothetical protein n=1 Tax=Arthrobacter sp. ERGS1:01 TaxID=1704044 RepID=UPI00404017F7